MLNSQTSGFSIRSLFNLPFWLIEITISAICYFLLNALPFTTRWSYYWILITNIIMSAFLTLSHGLRTYDHGLLNFILFATEVIIFTSIYFFVLLLTKLRKYLLRGILMLLILILVPVSIIYFTKIKNSTQGWELGIGNKRLINDGQHCTVPIPTYSEFEARNGWFNIQSLLPK